MKIISTARDRHVIVLAVNIVSPNKNHVNIGNIIIPVDDPINLAVQTEPVTSTIDLQANQKATEVGTPMANAAMTGLSFHHSEIYCAFNWNHPRICPRKNRAIPMYMPISAPRFQYPQRLF